MITKFPIPLLLSLLVTVPLSKGCPPSCICKWRNGKQTVECINKHLLIIPEGLDPATQVLDISGNNFQSLQREKFFKMDLINLQKVFLSRCSIKAVQDDAFKGLTNLVELDLSENFLEMVPTGALINCLSLMKLSLSKNPIKSLKRLAFNHLSFLTALDLTKCEIGSVHEAAFDGLYSLEWLDLSKNILKTLPDLSRLPHSLKGMQLEENPWKCDCHIRQLNTWLKKEAVPVLIQPRCQEPKKFKNHPVKSLQESELACMPEVSPTTFYFELEEGKNMSLLCQVKSIPQAKISWWFKGQVLHNNTELLPGLRLVYFIEESIEEMQSNLFIYNLNSQDNGTFYCSAENPAGTSYANYTIMIILKQDPLTEGKQGFPIEFISIFLAAGLVFVSLCFVLLVMSIIRCHTDSNKKTKRSDTKDNFLPETASDVSQKSNPKIGEKHGSEFQTGRQNREINVEYCYQVPEQNPDIINGIRSDEQPETRTLLPNANTYDMNASDVRSGTNFALINPSNPSLRNPLNRHHSQPLQRVTLPVRPRAIPSSSFEQSYVESYDVRYTADGYPARHAANASSTFGSHTSASVLPSQTETLVPNQTLRVSSNDDKVERMANDRKYVGVQTQTDGFVTECSMAMGNDDVLL